jgi:hypothetical protein
MPYLSIYRMYDDSCMRKVQQQFVIVLTATIVIWISTVTTVIIPQAAYAQKNQENQSSSNNCASDQLPASINGTIQCMQQGQCYSEQFEGKEAKHCNFMMSNQ